MPAFAGVLPGYKLTQNLQVRPSDETWAQETGFPVGVYVRISTDSDLQKTSIANQEKAVREWCSDPAHYYPVHDVYIDDARSGAYMVNRPEVQRLLADARAGRIHGIVTKEISRVSRDVLDTLSIKRGLEDAGACYIDMIHSYDSRRDGDELFLVMYGVIAQKERKTTGRRVALTMKQKAREGKNPVIRPAFGYRKSTENRDRLEPDPERAPVYREIVSRFLNGWGKKRICNWLNESAVWTGQGKPWTPPSLTVILRNPVYLGHTFWSTAKIVKGPSGRAQVVSRPESDWVFKENTHDALASREDWEAVQALLEERRSGSAAQRGQKWTKRYPLVGYLRCGICGSHLYGHRFTKRPRGRSVYYNEYYVCHQELGRCGLPYRRRRDMEAFVNRSILDLLSDPELIGQYVAEKAHLYLDGMDELKARRSDLATHLEKLAQGIKQLALDRAMGVLTDQEFAEHVAAVREKRRELEQELVQLDRQLKAVDNLDAQAARIVTAVEQLVLPSDPAITDEVMEQLYYLLLRRVVVAQDGSANIEWTFDTADT